MLDIVYPVGSIYTSTNNVSPATFLGGTWEAISGRFLYAQDSAHTAGSTGGNSTYTPSGTISGGAVNGHSLTMSEMPSHVHSISDTGGGQIWINGLRNFRLKHISTSGGGSEYVWSKDSDTSSGLKYISMVTSSVGSGTSHTHTFTQPTFTGTSTTIMPPYLSVYMWKRTA